MADFNSKYAGAQVEALLDIVKQGGTGGGGEGGEVQKTTEAEIAAMGFTKNVGTITGVKMNGANKGSSGVVDLGTVITEHQDISGKQDKITDLEAIREGASKGATALQSVPSEYITESELNAKGYLTAVPSEYITESELNAKGYITEHQDISGKQDKIEDLDAIRSGAAKGATALQSIPSEYVTDTELNNKGYATTAMLEDKVDKITGKQLSTEDFTTELKDKLEGLNNYDDSELREAIEGKQDTLVSGTTLKTVNGQSLLGEGNITIEGGSGGGGTGDYYTKEEENAFRESILDEEGYLYSNGEKVDMRFTRSLLPVGTQIPANANLNTKAYLKIGKYFCSLNVDAKTITNCPTSEAFSMEVFNPLGTNVDDEDTRDYTYRIRVLTAYKTGMQYIQYCATSGTAGVWNYNAWKVVPQTAFTLNSSKNGGTAALGSATQGVYVAASGQLTKMTYTLAKSVPSNAVFTDTNTKVTSVGNHYTPAEDTASQIDAPEGEVVIGLKRDAAGHVVGVVSATMSGGGTLPEGYATEQYVINMVGDLESDVVEPLIAQVDTLSGTVSEHLTAYEELSNAVDGINDTVNGLDGDVAGLIDEVRKFEMIQPVAWSGSYNDLTDKPTIPNGTVTAVKINGSTKNPDESGVVDLGTIESGGSSGGSTEKEVIRTSGVEDSLSPNKIYVGSGEAIRITNFETTDAIYEEYHMIVSINFFPENTLELPDYVLWANGAPTNFGVGIWELSVVKVMVNDITPKFIAVLTKFE